MKTIISTLILLLLAFSGLTAWYQYSSNKEILAKVELLKVLADSARAVSIALRAEADTLAVINQALQEAHDEAMSRMKEEKVELQRDTDSLGAEMLNMIPDSILRGQIEVRLVGVRSVYEGRISVLEARLAQANNLIMERNREIRLHLQDRVSRDEIEKALERQVATLQQSFQPLSFFGNFRKDVKKNLVVAGGTILIYEGLKLLVGG